MKSIRDWVSSQLVSKSLVSCRSLSSSGSFFCERPSSEELDSQGSADTDNSGASSCPLPQAPIENSHQPLPYSVVEKKDPLLKIEELEIKFLRLICRLGLSFDNLLVTKVLYRLHLAALVRIGESDLKSVNFRKNVTREIAEEQERAGHPALDFSLRVLLLGKTGVGKSATINSVFDQRKTVTDAFRPATDHIQEVSGTVNGVKITFIDTPGLWPSPVGSMRENRKILLSVKKLIRKSPPDVVLYFDRLDLMNMGYSDFPLLKLVSDVFGTSIWFNTILVMTHSSSPIPEGPNGYPLTYESYVNHCTNTVQQYIHQAVSDSKLENPVLLVENHPNCRTNVTGDKVLPDGQVWKSQFLLLCISTKVLGDANALLKLGNSIELGPLQSSRTPSLPHLLSSLLRRRSASNPNVLNDEIDNILLSDTEEEDDYDQLPPIRILTKSQFERLTNSQKEEYLDELDYRETLYMKKQLKEESRRRRENKIKEESLAREDNADGHQESPEGVLLPDMAVPPSFDSDCPVHRYRYLVTSDQWLVRPVLDPQGWDHDVGFDGINLETAVEIRRNMYASVTGQMSKDKQDFSIQSECSAAYVDPRGPTYSALIDVQSAGRELIYTFNSNAILQKLKHNTTDIGVSMTSFGQKHYVGAKLENALLVGKRMKLVMNAGGIGGSGLVAHGGSLEATIRGIDYPARNDYVSLTMTILSFNKEVVLGGTFQSEFRPSRCMRVSVNANLNSRKIGQFCIKASSSEHTGIALVAVFSLFKFLFRRKASENINKDALEGQ